jgi:hypothetical protein
VRVCRSGRQLGVFDQHVCWRNTGAAQGLPMLSPAVHAQNMNKTIKTKHDIDLEELRDELQHGGMSVMVTCTCCLFLTALCQSDSSPQ